MTYSGPATARARPEGEPPQTTLVIGGGGFVGSAIVRAATMRRELQPIACARRQHHAFSLSGAPFHPCDARDSEQLGRLFSNATYVVNCVLGDARSMIAATLNICSAAQRAGVRRLVHVSSMAVYGGTEGLVAEDSALHPNSAYGKAKLECEAIVADFVKRGGDAVVLRPGCVVGPAGQQWVGRVVRWLRAGRLGHLGELGQGYCNVTFNDDLASAVIAALVVDLGSERIFNVAVREPWTWNEYFRTVAQEIDVPFGRCSRLQAAFEAGVLALPLHGVKLLKRRANLAWNNFPEPMTPSLFRLWRQEIRMDVQRARAVLGFRETPMKVGVDLAVRSFLSNNEPAFRRSQAVPG